MIFFEVIFAILSIVILSIAMVLQPVKAKCPGDYTLVEGVRRNGAFICGSPPPGNCGSSKEPTWPCPEAEIRIYSKIYCTGGSVPIQVDFQTVGCMRR